MGSSVVLQYGVSLIGRFLRKCTRTNRALNIQPATQTTRFSDFQSNEANSSNQSILAPSDFPTVFSHETTPSNSATQTVKAASLSPLPSISKQGTSVARSARPGSTKIITVSPFNVDLEKKRWVKSTDSGKQLMCRKSLCEKHGKIRRKTAKEDPFLVKK